MTFGIPGSSNAAIIMGGMIMLGLRPVHKLFIEQGDIVVAIMLSYVLANFIFALLAIIAMKQFVKVLSLPTPL
ncbi:MAG: tripartite tricarboxylate transporter permease [Anaerotruncus sp.]|nr:tripartite tricarboxylate transporter permease [Anaerotruncus sp.]